MKDPPSAVPIFKVASLESNVKVETPATVVVPILSINPFLSTVITGIKVDVPYVPESTLVEADLSTSPVNRLPDRLPVDIISPDTVSLSVAILSACNLPKILTP